MKKRRSIVVIVAIALSILLGYIVFTQIQQSIITQRQKAKVSMREASFISLYYVATEAAGENYEDRPKTIDELLDYHGSAARILLKHFPDGVRYEVTEGGFILEEPVRRSAVYGKADRLIASDLEWPHWEVSGELATKTSDGSDIPERYK